MADTLNISDTKQKIVRERLSNWESRNDTKAPLTDKQKDSFMDLTALAVNRQISSDLLDDELSDDTGQLSLTAEADDQNTPFSSFLSESGLKVCKIENAQQFFSWFSEMEDNIGKEEEDDYRCYIRKLQSYRDQCNDVLEEVTLALNYLKELHKQYVYVSTETNALHDACEHLLAEQTRLMNTAESISNKLSYFNELDRISSKLGSSSISVTNESFIPMLSRLDECILYLTNNKTYKESTTYLTSFKNCLARALSMIKLHTEKILQNATQQVQPKKDAQTPPDNAFTLYYGKFRTNAPRIKPLMEQLEQRIDKSPEYQQTLSDCHQSYFSQREILLGPSVASTIQDLAQKHVRDHCSLMRSGCALMVHVCEDEYQLYYHFFSKHTRVLDDMLEKICSNLYDLFRPLIIHINHLETLAELCSILKIEMIEEHVQNNSQELRAFESIINQMLMDVQERLVYRTYIYIKSDILNYAAASGDLAYPEKLEMMESIAESLKTAPNVRIHSRTPSNASSTSLEVAHINTSSVPETKPALNIVDATTTESFSTNNNMPMSPADLHGMWYPTVRRTLVTLSKLYRCIDKTTFQGLSQEALQSCTESLNKAKDGIVNRKTLLDGELFVIKHLLILREQIAPFHADFSIRETSLDFSRLKDAAYGLIQKKSQLFSFNTTNALLRFIVEGTPQVTEHFVDSKKDVDLCLKKICEEFIHHVTEIFVLPLQSFLSRASVIINIRNEEKSSRVVLRQQPFATPEKVHDVVAETYKNLKTKLPSVQRSMSLYLANNDTEFILFKPIKSNIQQTFQQLLQLLKEHYTEEDTQIVACPSSEQISLLLSTSSSSSTTSSGIK